MELDDNIYKNIKDKSARGDELIEQGRYDEAIQFYQAALQQLPEPTSQWEAGTWLLTAIGEAHFFKGDYKTAVQSLLEVMHYPNAIGNPFIHMRLGQVQFELGNDILAADELTRAYMGAGRNIFDTEDSKYFEFLKTRIVPPPEGW